MDIIATTGCFESMINNVKQIHKSLLDYNYFYLKPIWQLSAWEERQVIRNLCERPDSGLLKADNLNVKCYICGVNLESWLLMDLLFFFFFSSIGMEYLIVKKEEEKEQLSLSGILLFSTFTQKCTLVVCHTILSEITFLRASQT